MNADTNLENIDKDRPYMIATDGSVVQLHPLEEKALLDELGQGDGKAAIFEELNTQITGIEENIAQKKVDAAVPPRVRKALPSSGPNVAKIEIHMRQVFMHLIGRRNTNDKANIIGLYGFGSSINKLVQGYKNGCPYAGWILWEIEKEILGLRQEINRLENEHSQYIKGLNIGIEYEPFTVKRPTVETLQFNAVHAHQMASILKQYDSLLRNLYPYLKSRFISYDDWKEKGLFVGAKFRKLFLKPSVWLFVGKESCERKDEVYLVASQRMGEIPELFLSGEQKPDWV